jgi:hypothetical protein
LTSLEKGKMSLSQPTSALSTFYITSRTSPISCSVVSLSAYTSTNTYSITSGYKGIFTTYTSGFTSTVTESAAATAFVRCRSLNNFEDPSQCHVSALVWASLVITFITIQLTWWVFDIPLLWKSGFKVFLDSVSWQCVRSHQPGVCGIITARRGGDSSQYARIFYLGLKRADEPLDWTFLKLSKTLLTEAFTLIATIITIYQACAYPETEAKTKFLGAGLWAFPSLPSALIGLCLLVGEKTQMSNKKLCALVILTLLLIGTAVALILWKFGSEQGVWYLPIIIYAIMILPVGFLANGRGMILACMYVWFGRVAAIGVTSLTHEGAGLPWCKLQGPAFGAVYLTMGGIAAILGAFGGLYHSSRQARPSRGGIFD